MRPLAGCRSGGVGSVNREARLPVMATDDSTLGTAAEWWEELREFRTTHRPKRVSVDGVGWEYIASGDGEEALLILPRGGGPENGRVGGRGRDVHCQPLERTPERVDDKHCVGPGGIGGERHGDAGFYRRGEGERARALARDLRQTSHDRLLWKGDRGETRAGSAAAPAGAR